MQTLTALLFDDFETLDLFGPIWTYRDVWLLT